MHEFLEQAFAIHAPIPQALAWLRFTAVRPRGWLEQQLRHDLEHGFVGCLDRLVPGLIDDDRIYDSARLSLYSPRKELGVLGPDAEWQVQYLWWNSETQSNWRDGWLRSALLLEHPQFLPQVQRYIAEILASQDADGYLGIYAPDLRYRQRGENGELWAQATLLRVLLGYFEASSDPQVLQALERAVACTMRQYAPGQAHPFAVERPYAGISHGLMFTDVLDRLAQLGGDQRYAEYALWLYQEFSASAGHDDDAGYAHLSQPEQVFVGHGVHTYEHLRALLLAYYSSGNPLLHQALRSYLARLERCLSPSGGPIGDEWIGGRSADHATTGYEYCSIHELFDSYTQLLQKQGAAEWGDRAEWLIFNAGQGARHPQRSAIAYLKTDTSTAMVGTRLPDEAVDPAHPQTRYKYSPVHQDVAVCCVPNAGRIYPYYIKAMWFAHPDGLSAALYGPCVLHSERDGIALQIQTVTAYPLDLRIQMRFELAAALEFSLRLRYPAWATGYHCLLDGQPAGELEAGWICIRRRWQGGERLELQFEAPVRLQTGNDGQLSVCHGPLLYVRPIAGHEQAGRSYRQPDLYDSQVLPAPGEPLAYQIDPAQAAFELIQAPPDPQHPWSGGPRIAATLIHPLSGLPERLQLVPIGATLLRQAAFAPLR